MYESSGCDSKRENQELSKYEFKKWCYKCDICVNEPQNNLKI